MTKMFIVLLVFLSSITFASTQVQKKISELPKLYQPIKLTVGPDDNFQVDVNKEETMLTFTRKSNLSTRIFVQSPFSNDEKKLLDETADASFPVLHPNGKTIAFVYYKNDSRGDLCILENQQDTTPKCMNVEGEVESPQWINDNELIFLSRDFITNLSLIKKINIKNKSQEILEKGLLGAPAVDNEENYLAYNQQNGKKSFLVIKNLKNNQRWTLNIDLPGISGFPDFSPDSKWLYFSQYFSDTNEDQKIDANDNSVIFRVNVKQIINQTHVVPEQITSGEQNCGFPIVRKQFLYVTCDFEGSLDVYKLPPSGVVPVIWSKDLIINAHKSSRNYNQRILLLNNLLYRGVITSGEEYSLRIFSNFLLNDDVVAANYYLDKLILTADEQLKNDWKSVGLYLKARALTKQQLSRENSREYKTKITELIKEIQNKNSATSKLVQAILYSYIERYVQSLKLIKSISDLELSGVNHILYSLVLNGLESKKIINADNVFRYYKPLLNSDKIPQESQLFYAFVYLSKLQTLKDKKSRIILLEKQMATFKNKIQLAQIFKAEWSSLKIIVEQDKKSKSKYYQVLDKIMSETRSEYFLRKSIYVRVLENFIEADEVQYLTYVATTWLKYTDKSDTEFAYARDIYIDKVFARAYMNFSDKNYNYAANNFFGAVGFTDDLESHFGYIKSSFFNNKGQDLNKTYESMYQRKVINESIHYVNSILELSQFLSEINNKSINIERKKVEQVKLFEDVLKKLKDASTFFQTPVYQLLLGFSYLKLTELSIDRYEFSQEMSSLAHKHLMLAYDLGRYNKRVRASALSNLSFLHLHISNWGMAKRFFEMREKLGFVDNDQMFSHYWFYAKASYYLSDYEVAISSIQRLLKNVKNFKDRDAVLLQKLAFYQLSNGDYKSAEINFLAYLNIAGKDDLWNIAKSELGLGYAQFKMFTDKKTRNNLLKTRALNSFKKVLAKVETLKTLTVGGERKIEQNPQRLKMLAQGYMAQLLEGKEAITALNNYLNTLNQISNSLSDLAMIKSKWQASIIKTQLNIAHKHYINNDIVKSHKYLKLSFANLREYIEENTLAFNTDLHNALVSWSDLALATNFTENTKEFNGYLSGAISEIKKLDTENPSVKRLLLRLLK